MMNPDYLTNEEVATIRDLHEADLRSHYEAQELPSVRDVAFALNLSEEQVRSYLAEIRSKPASPRRKFNLAWLVPAFVGAAMISALMMALIVSVRPDRANARSIPEPTIVENIPFAEVPAAAPEVPLTETHSEAIAPEPVKETPAPERVEPRVPVVERSTAPVVSDDGSGLPSAQFEEYPTAPPQSETLPEAPGQPE